MAIDRRRVIYEGRVQGVGFRMTARRLSTGFPISGYVRNRDDSRVELLVEGELDFVTSFLRAIRREFGDMILDIREEPELPGGESLADFSIRD